MDEKVKFVATVLAGEVSVAEVCRQFGISRKTGYLWLGRYRTEGVTALEPRSHARRTQAHQTPAASVEVLVQLKGQYPTWGPKKLVQRLHDLQAAGRLSPAVVIPAPSTAGAVLAAHGLVQPRQRHPRPAPPTQPLVAATQPNALWCADFKGSCALGDGSWCTPLTITDQASRYVVRCQALTQTSGRVVQPLFELSFREFGLPEAIRTDNGPPFASTGFGGLTPLAVWWLRLGIRLERITPGRPQQNGRHERVHRTLAADTLRPPAATLQTQQQRFAAWQVVFNHERPHAALGMRPPASCYTTSPRAYPTRLLPLDYPAGWEVRRVRPSGTIKWQGAEVYVSQALIGQPVGLRGVGDGQWELVFASLPLAVLCDRTRRLYPLCPWPPLPNLSPISSV